MFVVVQHQISDPRDFWPVKGQAIRMVSSDLKLHHTFSSADGSRAIGLWEAPSVAAVREYLEPALGLVSRNDYFEVANKDGIALPRL